MREDPQFGDLAALRAEMVKWARGMTRGRDNTEDVVQTALLRMFANRQRAPQHLREIAPWARMVLLNTFRDDLRATRRLPGFTALDDVNLSAVDNPETVTYCRQVFRMVLGVGADFLLAEPESETPTARSRRFRARRDLHARVGA